jgi:hypothetical protein
MRGFGEPVAGQQIAKAPLSDSTKVTPKIYPEKSIGIYQNPAQELG